MGVSTHSRLKAAGCNISKNLKYQESFNTQPPKGGWLNRSAMGLNLSGFNTQPPKGGWVIHYILLRFLRVSTHSRLKAAGAIRSMANRVDMFQHTAA